MVLATDSEIKNIIENYSQNGAQKHLKSSLGVTVGLNFSSLRNGNQMMETAIRKIDVGSEKEGTEMWKMEARRPYPVRNRPVPGAPCLILPASPSHPSLKYINRYIYL